jgi:hypothetical protein
MPVFEGLRRVIDRNGTVVEVSAGMLRVEESPAEGLLRGDNGIRYRWQEVGSAGRRGHWVQLLPPESSEADEFLDPRAAFCEGDVSEVWTQQRRHRETSFKVKKVDQDRYQLLLDRYPPRTHAVSTGGPAKPVPPEACAAAALEAPLPHHQGSAPIVRGSQHARWPLVHPVPDPSRGCGVTHGSHAQRHRRAAVLRSERRSAAPTSPFSKDPPGSGKTTAICEIVQQLVEKGKRVLLCASTHVAIDNVLERLLGIGRPRSTQCASASSTRWTTRCRRLQLDERGARLSSAWRNQPSDATSTATPSWRRWPSAPSSWRPTSPAARRWAS